MAQKDDESDGIVDQLRRIRVEELRREVQRRDVTIVSLELKVKMMEEERERSLKEEAEKVDLKKDLGETTPLPENLAVSGDVSDDKENRSFNESNSTTQKGEGQARNGVVKDKARPEPERNEPNTGRIGSEPGNDSVMNGKVDNIDDAGTNEEKSVKKASRAGRPGELESVGESKREKEAASKQSSDVQSSASLSRKKRRRKGGGVGGSSSGEEPEGDEVSPATKRISAVKSEPLIKLLGIIRSHRLGSVFERRLRSQESERYKKLIRQHMDLQTVQSRLDRGVYADCTHKFFRDLLLIFNNGVIFFRRSSPEQVAAQELRALVRKELNRKLRKPQPVRTVKLEPKHEAESLSKPNNTKSFTMVPCETKRSSMKALTDQGANRKADKREKEVVEKPNSVINNQRKNDGNSFVKVDQDKQGGIRKKRTKERPSRRNTRTNNNKGGGEMKHEYGGNELSSHDALEVIKKESTARKKQGAASFLKRMKQNSPSEVMEDSDVSEGDDSNESKGDKEVEEKKRRGRKMERRGERVTRSSMGGRGGKEENAKVKRGVGRPPKRPETVATATGKRGRDNCESEVVGSAGRSRKRARR